jgi:hypothetical protein
MSKVNELTLEYLAEELETLKGQRVYELHYKYGYQKPKSKFFRFSGNMKEAKEHAQRHCIDMGYIFIWCNPAVVDLDEQFEAKKRGDFEESTIR